MGFLLSLTCHDLNCHNEKIHRMKNKVSLCLVKGYDVTSIQLTKALLIVASKCLHTGGDGKSSAWWPRSDWQWKPCWNTLVHWVGIPNPYVSFPVAFAVAKPVIRTRVYQSQSTQFSMAISLPRVPYTLSHEVPTFHFPVGLRQSIPSYSDSCRLAIDWPDV